MRIRKSLRMNTAQKGDEPEIKLSVEVIPSNGAVPLAVDDARGAAVGNESLPKVQSPNKSSPSATASPKINWKTLATILSEQVVSKSRPDQWGLLTAVTEKAKKRTQGSHIMLHNFEHVLGRTVTEVSCMFESPAVSGRHCTITRKLISSDGIVKNFGTDPAAGDLFCTFVKDSSSNGTFINKERLERNGAEVRLRHGDVISLVALPEHGSAFAFVFREVLNDSSCKRKGCPSDQAVELPPVGHSKRIRSTGKCVAASEGPVSLDDVRRLQKSNEELRQQLEANALEMEKMRGEFRAAQAVHLVELKELRASVTEMYAKQIAEIRLELVSKSKEVEESTALCSVQETKVQDLNHRLASAAQSRVDAEEAINNHVTSIGELKKRLDEELSHHEKERAEWEANLDAAVERTRMDASDELKRHSDASARLQKQQQDIIAGLQDAEKENRRLADSLRIKLEAERQAVIIADDKGRRSGLQLQEERLLKENASKKITELQEELALVHKDLESEREARESAGAKVVSLELAKETAIRDLTLEKQRLQGARERIVLRETQLRAFYSTAAQVEALQQKQQEQLKVMLRTLEDGDGDGDYPESRNPKGFDQSACVGVQALALRQTSSAPDPSLLLQDKGMPVYSGNVDGEEKKLSVEGEPAGLKVGNAEPDWMDADTQHEVDADTQHEDENCLVVSNSPSTSKPEINGADATMGDQDVVGEGGDSGPKVMDFKADEETQVLQDHGIHSTTQLLADSLQEIGSSEGQAVLKERMGVKPRFWPARRNSNLGTNARGSISKNDEIVKGGHGMVGGEGEQAEGNGTCRLGSGGATMYDGLGKFFPNESVGTETAGEDDGLPPTGSPVVNVRTRTSGTHEDRQELESNKEAATMCTDDLLTSEVAGSWALGTQASVHTGNEVGSHRIVGARMSSALQNDTQLVFREPEGTTGNDDIFPNESVGTGTAAENDGLPPTRSPEVNLRSRTSGAHEDRQALESYKEAPTMCTDDLLTSEVAGSWALGTQASVHTGNEVGSHRVVGAGNSSAIQNDRLRAMRLREPEGTVCTDDLLASEVAGSWAAGTPASVHADNESISSDERDHPGPDERGSQVAATLSRPRSNPRHVLLDEVMHFADPVNSQNSLSPATTNPARNERDALNEMLDIVEPGFGGLHGLSGVGKHQSDIDESTTDDEDDMEVNTRNDGSQPLNQSPTVSVK